MSAHGPESASFRQSDALAFTRASLAVAVAFESYARAWFTAPRLDQAWRAFDADDRRETAVDFSSAWHSASSSRVRAAWAELRRRLLELNVASHALGLEWRAASANDSMGPSPHALQWRLPMLVASIVPLPTTKGARHG